MNWTPAFLHVSKKKVLHVTTRSFHWYFPLLAPTNSIQWMEFRKVMLKAIAQYDHSVWEKEYPKIQSTVNLFHFQTSHWSLSTQSTQITTQSTIHFKMQSLECDSASLCYEDPICKISYNCRIAGNKTKNFIQSNWTWHGMDNRINNIFKF